MTLVDFAVSAIFIGWFVLGVLTQIPHPALLKIRRRDPVGHLLPAWNFFSPRPIRSDFELWHRRWMSAASGASPSAPGTAGEWEHFDGIADRRPAHAFFNPRRRGQKAMFQACDQITIAKHKRVGGRTILLSIPYLLLLGKVSALSPDAHAVQFRIVAVRYQGGERLPTTIFVSGTHLIPEPAAPMATRRNARSVARVFGAGRPLS
ncbi:MAG: hypothetical protein ACR2OO_07460 [Thermomicrobiales bacterium]